MIIRKACEAVFAGLLLLGSAAAPAAGAADDQAAQILGLAGVRGGLVVHLGCGDGRLTAALRAGDAYVVHGLDADAASVEKARAHIHSLGLYGTVSVEQWTDPAHLPYADNLVNLLVISDTRFEIAEKEMQRVLAPLGVAYIRGKDGQWTKTVKPRPKDIDEWTHYLHGPDNNAVARDAVVDQPRHLQWVAEPTWARSHDTLASISAVVSSGGRVFYIVDEGSVSTVALPPKWALVARDAFNGVLLWKRPIDSWEGHLRAFRTGPAELPRRLVAVGERVYVTLGYGKPVTAIDAATGQTVLTYRGTDNALEIVCHDGTLLAVVGDRAPDNIAGTAMPPKPEGSWLGWPIYRETPPQKTIVAFNADSGSLLWRKSDADTAELMPTTLAAAGGRVFFQSPQNLVALDEKSGKPLWRAPRPAAEKRPSWSAPTLVVYGDVVLSGDRPAESPKGKAADSRPGAESDVNAAGGNSPQGELIAFSAATGRKLWSCPCRESYNSPPDVLVAGGLVWTGSLVSGQDPGITEGRDPHTGEVVRRRERDQTQFNPRMHHRCYRNKATDRYLILGRDGVPFINVATGLGSQNAWVRGGCQYGVMPCNGLLYAPSHSCACNIEIKLNGFNALAPESADRRSPQPIPDQARLEKGPAYAEIQEARPEPPAPADWPTYRHDARRTGRAGAEVVAEPSRIWTTPLNAGRLSSPVAAGGRVFVACIDAHAVCAIDAASGRLLWTFTAGGRVDSPPTIYQGLVLFGSADGRVYCLRASDGKPAWRFLAAPEDRRIVSYGQLESAWPVHGSVLVEDGVAYAVAGRSTFLDGGMSLCALDPRSGRKLFQKPIDQGALPDVLSSDGSSIFMRHVRFDRDGTALDSSVPHLFSSIGFLDDSWWHRSYWMFATRMGNAWGGWYKVASQAPAGRLLVLDDASIYGFGRNQYNNNMHVGLGTTRYRLFACAAKSAAGAAAGNPSAAAEGDEAPQPKAAKQKGKAAPQEPKTAYRWSEAIPLQARAMVLGGKTLFVAGPPDVLSDGSQASAQNTYYVHSPQTLVEQDAAFAGQRGALLMAVSAADGKTLSQQKLQSPPVFDGMIAANGRLYVVTMDGKVLCLGKSE